MSTFRPKLQLDNLRYGDAIKILENKLNRMDRNLARNIERSIEGFFSRILENVTVCCIGYLGSKLIKDGWAWYNCEYLQPQKGTCDESQFEGYTTPVLLTGILCITTINFYNSHRNIFEPSKYKLKREKINFLINFFRKFESENSVNVEALTTQISEFDFEHFKCLKELLNSMSRIQQEKFKDLLAKKEFIFPDNHL